MVWLARLVFLKRPIPERGALLRENLPDLRPSIPSPDAPFVNTLRTAFRPASNFCAPRRVTSHENFRFLHEIRLRLVWPGPMLSQSPAATSGEIGKTNSPAKGRRQC